LLPRRAGRQLVGVLPGMGPVATISILLPLTFGMKPVPRS
jgi:putative tricarboxylic transport membrane protein